MSSERDEIIELSIALFAYDRLTGQIKNMLDTYTWLREPQVPIHAQASRVHGITLEQVMGKTLDRIRVEALIERAEFLIAHNAAFDRGFVQRLFPAAQSKRWLCSMNGINWRSKGFGAKGLSHLIHAHGIKFNQAHRADSDVRAALMLLSQRDESGDYYPKELLHTYPARRRAQ